MKEKCMFCFVLALFVSAHLSLEINRLQNGDKVTGDGSSNVCGGVDSCECSPGETFIGRDLEGKECISKINDCELLIEESTENLRNIYLVLRSFNSNEYFITVTANDLSKSVCSSDTQNVSATPVFVHDYLTKMYWNPSWSYELKNNLEASILDGSKVQLKLAKHWSGLFLKLYIKCDEVSVGCVGIKFDGMRSYPLTNETVQEIISVAPSASSITQTLSTTTTPSVTTTSTPSLTTNSTSSLSTNSTSSLATISTSLLATISTSSLTTDSTSSLATNSTSSLTTNSTPPLTTSSMSFFKIASTPVLTMLPLLTKTSTILGVGSTNILHSSSSSLSSPFVYTLLSNSIFNATMINSHPSSAIPGTMTSSSITSKQNITTVTSSAIKSGEDDDLELYIGIIVAILLIILLIILIIICKRRQKKQLAVEQNNHLGVNTPRQHPSIRSLSSDAKGSITSPPSILNRGPSNYNEASTSSNPVYESNEVQKNGKENGTHVEMI